MFALLLILKVKNLLKEKFKFYNKCSVITKGYLDLQCLQTPTINDPLCLLLLLTIHRLDTCAFRSESVYLCAAEAPSWNLVLKE